MTSEDRRLPEVNIPGATMIFYDIRGRTIQELRVAMEQYGLRDSAGDPCHAFTSLEFGENGWEVKVTFPRWLPPPSATANLLVEWHAYMLNLARHEANHVRMYREALPSVRKAMREIRSLACTNSVSPMALASLELPTLRCVTRSN